VTVVADSSPLVILAKLDCFELLNRLFSRIYISAEVYQEVVVAGAGLPGASEVERADWVEVKSIQNQTDLEAAQQKYALGAGELSTILLAKELRADAVR
jgi:predicted nucleic acid-binding protein